MLLSFAWHYPPRAAAVADLPELDEDFAAFRDRPLADTVLSS
jgi:hypothetical protein